MCPRYRSSWGGSSGNLPQNGGSFTPARVLEAGCPPSTPGSDSCWLLSLFGYFQHASWTVLSMATAIHSRNAASATLFGWRISSRCNWGMETATVVSFCLAWCQLIWHCMGLWVEWVGVGVSEADEQARRRTLCIFCLQRIFTSFLHTCSRLEESSETVV